MRLEAAVRAPHAMTLWDKVTCAVDDPVCFVGCRPGGQVS